jgi:hypothetical protein
MVVKWDASAQIELAGILRKLTHSELDYLRFYAAPSEWFDANQHKISLVILKNAFGSVFSVPKTRQHHKCFINGSAGLVLDDAGRIEVTEPRAFNFEQPDVSIQFGIGNPHPATIAARSKDAVLACYHNHYITQHTRGVDHTHSKIKHNKMYVGFGAVDVEVGGLPLYMRSCFRGEEHVFTTPSEWASGLEKTSNKLKKMFDLRFSRRLFVFSGDSSRAIYRNLKEASLQHSGVSVLNEEDLVKGSLKDRLSVGDGPIFLCMSPHSIVELISRIKDKIGVDSLIQNWNYHVTDLVTPRLCQNCRVKYNKKFSNKEFGVSLSENDNLYMRGLGCDECYHGYSGYIVLRESTEGHDASFKLMSSIASREKDKDKNGFSSPYKLLDDIVQGKAFTLISKSAEASLTHGAVQASDLNKVLF